MQQVSKSHQLLSFLKDFALLRRKRITAYGSGDRVLWFADLPNDLPSSWKDALWSVFSSDKPDETPDLWLEVRKKRMPELPPIPEEVKRWLPENFLKEPEAYVRENTDNMLSLLREKINIIKSSAESKIDLTAFDVAEEQFLKDYPEVEQAWLEYLINQWESWAQEMRVWQKVQNVYENVDFMRRRLEEAEERYELVLAVGLLQWRDPGGNVIKRHLLTAPAEISLDAVRSVLRVSPAATFDKFGIDLSMLDFQQMPDLEPVKEELDMLLEELDVRIWDREKVGQILNVIANRASSDAQVDENAFKPLERADKTFRIVFAPALVLRERRSTAYEELIRSFIDAFENNENFPTTAPWDQFVAEGETSGGSGEGMPEGDKLFSSDSNNRLYFPLPMNNEQKMIAERLSMRPYVLVKGPPGTGKSHTIANLICHLLALGERVLVTAHAPKALTVLRDLLPGDVPNLCVMASGSTREEQRILESSVRTIISRRNEWNSEWAHIEIKRLEEELSRLEEKRAGLEVQLRRCREAETYEHTLFGGYQGTAAQIAKQLKREQETYGWIPDVISPESRCPLEKSDLKFIAEVHKTLTDERLNELQMEIGDFYLPDPEEFRNFLKNLNSDEQRLNELSESIEKIKLEKLRNLSDYDLNNFKTFLESLEEEILKTSHEFSSAVNQIVNGLLLEQRTRCRNIIQELEPLVGEIKEACGKVKGIRVELPDNVERAKLLRDTRCRFEHFEKGGWRGFGFIAPQVVRETRYVEEKCLINGEAPRDLNLLQKLVNYLELEFLIQQLCSVCVELANLLKKVDPRSADRVVEEFMNKVSNLLKLFEEKGEILKIIPLNDRVLLVNPDEIGKWLKLIEIEMIRRSVEKAEDKAEAWKNNIRALSENNVHPCMLELEKAILERDAAKWRSAWETRERVTKERKRLNRYMELLSRLDRECPGLKNLLESSRGDIEWQDRILQLDKAWAWAAAKAWLYLIVKENDYNVILAQIKDIEKKIKSIILRLVELKAWNAFFERLDSKTQQSLIAWQKAIARVGKDKGKYAFKHRRAAQRYLKDCIQKIPVWIMPVHKLWGTVTAVPGMFDTIIIDEASQAGIDSLILLLLGKRILVVGDDMQNSPEGVGIAEDDIARLAREHLRDFRFREEFRPDASLYDHAERAFGNVISLREHFRCVPEIIRFSNSLCYSNFLISLRQPPIDRLPPLKTTYVSGGYCEGEGQRLINRSEADEIVKAVQECLKDEAYKGKTMGVIVLQGSSQAELIERKLAEVLDPKERDNRKIRCGVPATFQGDQRDVIFLSLVVAPNHSYRALTSLSYQRRFNVAMSRARDQVWLFHSVQQHELNPSDLRYKLLHFFNSSSLEDLETYQEKERLEREFLKRPHAPGNQPDPYESWFEVEAALELLRRGYRIKPQYKVSGYRIDLVIEGSEHRLAVECDGDVWHGVEQYVRDMARQRQLERAGWTFVRIRSSEFYANKKKAIQLIEKKCEELKIYPMDLVSYSGGEPQKRLG
ncbi:MAG: DUF559 domain-containing protein [Clostridia bacterium]|nr:DUF559 domain-containing protein [Clostridia bacterium]